MIKSNQIECSNKYSKVHRLDLCETAVQNIPSIPKENSAVLSVHPSLPGLWELEVFLTLLILLKILFQLSSGQMHLEHFWDCEAATGAVEVGHH